MEAATAPNAIKPITRILMFPPLSERNLKPALLDRRVPGGPRHIGRRTIMSSKVGLEKRRPDTVISECRVHRREASEKRGLAGLRQSPWGERASGSSGG